MAQAMRKVKFVIDYNWQNEPFKDTIEFSLPAHIRAQELDQAFLIATGDVEEQNEATGEDWDHVEITRRTFDLMAERLNGSWDWYCADGLEYVIEVTEDGDRRMLSC